MSFIQHLNFFSLGNLVLRLKISRRNRKAFWRRHYPDNKFVYLTPTASRNKQVFGIKLLKLFFFHPIATPIRNPPSPPIRVWDADRETREKKKTRFGVVKNRAGGGQGSSDPRDCFWAGKQGLERWWMLSKSGKSWKGGIFREGNEGEGTRNRICGQRSSA